jgi:tetratricopeptide (TPR) repeat protein
MKRIFIILLLLLTVLGASAQKSRVLSAIQMIDQKKYEEAKEAIELAIWNDKTSSWARTYYVRGLLCQVAFEDGFEKREVKKTSLYPDQLYLAYSSYERALELDLRKRLYTSISQKYYLLSNDFRNLGQRRFLNGDYEEAFRAFEHALLINKSSLIHADTDTSLIYNTALAAYESQNWDKAIAYLTGLHEQGHAPSTSLLLYNALLETGDTLKAEEVLLDGLEIYHYENQAVLYLVNLYAMSSRDDQALSILEKAIQQRPENYRFLWARGLIQGRKGESEKAIESFKAALELAPDESKLYYHIGVIYYNEGIYMTEQALKITSIDKYLEKKTLARDYYLKAVSWLEKAYEMDPFDQELISKLYQLYNQLQMEDKENELRPLVE